MQHKIKMVTLIIAVTIINFIVECGSTHAQDAMNTEEAKFIGILQEASRSWRNAPNDIQREQIPTRRDKALCNINKNVLSWSGNVERIKSYLMSEEISFGVVISDHVTLRTEGDLQNEGSKIRRGTKLFNEVENLSVGQRVIFSGIFLKGDKTCLDETSFTNSGSVTDPEFEFLFTDVRLPE